MKINSFSISKSLSDIKRSRVGKNDGYEVEKQVKDEIALLEKQLSKLKSTLKDSTDVTSPEQNIEGPETSSEGGINHTIQSLVNTDTYKNITMEDGFKIMGYFIEKGYKEGYPWKLFKKSADDKMEKINPLQAVERLSRGEEILMEPTRRMDFNLSASELGVIASVANPQSALLSSMMYLSTTNSMKHEIKLGPSVYIRNLGELKLLKDLYDPASSVSEKNKESKTANDLSRFLMASSSNLPWRTLKNDNDIKTGDIIKGSLKKGIMWALCGMGAGAVIGGVGGAVIQNLSSHAIGWMGAAVASMVTGATAGTLGLMRGAGEVKKGKDINAFEALDRVLKDKPVILQKQELRGIGIPVFGTINYLKDYEEQVVITGAEQLKLFSKILQEENFEKADNK